MTPKIVVFSPRMNFLRTVAEMLSGNGFQIVPKMQTLSTLPDIQDLQPNLLILDTESDVLPLMVETLQDEKNAPYLADIPIVLANSVGDQSPVPQLPGVAVLGWPIDSGALLECVRQLLSASTR